jgi:hypothetical protein
MPSTAPTSTGPTGARASGTSALPLQQPYYGLAGSVYSYSQISGRLSVELVNETHVVATSGKCLDAEETKRFNNLIPAENQRFYYG